MKPLIHLFADESCLGNQFGGRASPGGAAGLVAHWTGERWERRDYWLSERDSTNNRMALRSAIAGLRALSEPCRVIFASDSNYLVQGMSEWIHNWVERGWKRKRGSVSNKRLWQELLRTARRHEIEWRWVRGHAGHPENEYVDDLAVRAAKQQNSSGGLVPSGYTEWLDDQREKYEKYFDVFAFQPPNEDEAFDPAPLPPA